MAHTLKAYYYTDPATAVTVDFYGAVADNDGIAVDSYQMGIPGIEQARNNSLYSDSPRPVYSKHSTVTDVLTVTVRGSTNTNLYTNLHLLAKLGEYARQSSENVLDMQSAYLELKPGGSSSGEVLYAHIYDCRVEMPSDWGNHVDATLTVEDVTVTIERGLWRSIKMREAPDTNASSISNSATAASKMASSADIGGDTTALFKVNVYQPSTGTPDAAIDRVIVGYRSKARGGVGYNSLGIREAESQTLGTDTTSAADATASGGNVAKCTFATVTTDATRVSRAGDVANGVHRVFARMKVDTSSSSSVYLKSQDASSASGAALISNTAVTVSSTGWLVYDLGIVRVFQDGTLSTGGGGSYGAWELSASRLTGSGTDALYVDWVFIMPTEGYLTASGCGILTTSPTKSNTLYWDNCWRESLVCGVFNTSDARVSAIQYTASMDPIPGPFEVYWLIGQESGSVFDVGGTINDLNIIFQTVPRFLMPSEV